MLVSLKIGSLIAPGPIQRSLRVMPSGAGAGVRDPFEGGNDHALA